MEGVGGGGEVWGVRGEDRGMRGDRWGEMGEE